MRVVALVVAGGATSGDGTGPAPALRAQHGTMLGDGLRDRIDQPARKRL